MGRTMRPGIPFEIHESRRRDSVRLSLSGELDLASTPILKDRLTRLRAKRTAVQLDLSKLEFIDSTGLHLLIQATRDARVDSWKLQIEPDVAPEVARLFKLVHFDHASVGDDSQED
jgi:anti-anti-sigma factor